MTWDYSKLRGKIKEKFKTQDAFATAIGISKTSLSLKLNNEREFTQAEMNKCVDALGEPKHEIKNLFFTIEVQETEQNRQEG